MSSKNPVIRQRYREARTGMVEEFSKKHKFNLKNMNQGYQLRLENLLDIYPTNGRWCWLPTKEWGDFDGEEDLRRIMLDHLKTDEQKEQAKETRDAAEQPTEEDLAGVPEQFKGSVPKVRQAKERDDYFCIKHAFVGAVPKTDKLLSYPILGLGTDDKIYHYKNGEWVEV